MQFGYYLCLFSSKSEVWSRFWGHIDRLIRFSGQIHFIAYILEKWASCDGSVCSQPRNLQIHLPIQIWFIQGIEAWRIWCSKKIWKWATCFFSFLAPQTSSSYPCLSSFKVRDNDLSGEGFTRGLTKTGSFLREWRFRKSLCLQAANTTCKYCSTYHGTHCLQSHA